MKAKLFLLAAGLATALTFNACSDGDNKINNNENKGFGTCSEFEAEYVKCSKALPQDLLYEYDACLDSHKDNEEVCDSIIEPSMARCLLNSGICGEASLEECLDHFNNECTLFYDGRHDAAGGKSSPSGGSSSSSGGINVYASIHACLTKYDDDDTDCMEYSIATDLGLDQTVIDALVTTLEAACVPYHPDFVVTILKKCPAGNYMSCEKNLDDIDFMKIKGYFYGSYYHDLTCSDIPL